MLRVKMIYSCLFACFILFSIPVEPECHPCKTDIAENWRPVSTEGWSAVLPQSYTSREYKEEFYWVPSVWLLHLSDSGNQSLIYSPCPVPVPWAAKPQVNALTVHPQGNITQSVSSLSYGWPRWGQEQQENESRSVTPLTSGWAGSHCCCFPSSGNMRWLCLHSQTWTRVSSAECTL